MYINRVFQPPSGESCFLFGPRGSGKSTWLKKHYPEKVLWIDFLNLQEERHFAMYPEALKEKVKGFSGNIIIMDEVQKVPQILDTVHSLIEEKKCLVPSCRRFFKKFASPAKISNCVFLIECTLSC